MVTLKITKKHHNHLNNPFPSRPRSLPFIQGTLLYNSQKLPPYQIFCIGKDFQLSWRAKHGGSLSISHRSQPTRPVWSTVPGQAFVAAALAETEVEESRGSFVIKDRRIHLVCNHQTIEDIRVINQDDFRAEANNHNDFSPVFLGLDQKVGLDDAQFPALLITGVISGVKERKKIPSSGVHENPKIVRKEISAYARYWILFDQKSSNELRFQVKLGKPNSEFQQKISPRSYGTYQGFSRKLGRIRRRRLGWYGCLPKRGAIIPAVSTVEDNVIIKGVERPDFNRVCLTYLSERNERFYGFGEQFSHMNFKGKRVPIFVQEQGIGRGDQPITFAANLVSFRAGGDWSTTYAPSPFYISSKMKSLYLEGYNYSVFDLTRDDRVQIQVHGDSVQGSILHGNSPLEFIERFTEAIGRPPELPEWIISGAVVGMQGGTDFVRDVWSKLQAYNVPISAFWLQDWVGQRKTVIGSQLWWNWEVDTTRYSGWQQLIGDLNASHIKMMTYCNPCLAPMDEKPNRRNLYEEAKKLDILVKDKKGETYMVPNTAFDVGMLDMTHPYTASWFKKILQEMVDDGVRGWMADFGEALPVDASLYSGLVFKLLSSTSKHSFFKYQRSEELLLRWMELNAFTTIFRTHEVSQKGATHVKSLEALPWSWP